jgi:carboxyl-terminal processing protease
MPNAKYLTAATALVLLAGCIFDSQDSHYTGSGNSTSVMLDTLYPTSAQADRNVELYLPIFDHTLPAGSSMPAEVLDPVKVREHSSGQIVQYRLTRQRFGSWGAEQEFKWNYFKLMSNFFFPASLPDTAGLAWQTGDFFKRVHAADSFTNYFDSTRAASIWNQIESSTKPGAIGVEVHLSATQDTVVVRRVVPGSPAALAGIAPGMAILAVDDSSLVGDSAIARFSRFAVGDSGTATAFKMLGPTGEFTAHMVRVPVAFPTVVADSISGVGYIGISSFTLETINDKNTYLEFRDALAATRRFAVTILDLRDNHGGVLDLAIRMCDEVIPKGVIINEEQRRYDDDRRVPLLSVNTYTASPGGTGEGRKYILLTNHFTASAAEIFVVATKENLKTPQMGTRSYGKGVGQVPINTPGKGLALVTFLHFRSSTGLDYHRKGLDPDYPDSAGSDSLLTDAAVLARNIVTGSTPKLSAHQSAQTRRQAQAIDFNRRQAIRRETPE